MIDLSLPLIGPALKAQAYYRAIAKRQTTFAALVYGTPGAAKSHLLDALALELTGSKHAIEHVNGQSLTVDLVRQWRVQAPYGNLFSKWTIKRVDEFDCASPAARNEVLTLLDYMKPFQLILATTNDYEKLRMEGNRRLESRFKALEVNGPSADEAIAYLIRQFHIPQDVASEIASSALPDGDLGLCGVNMRLCVEYAQDWLASQEAGLEALAA